MYFLESIAYEFNENYKYVLFRLPPNDLQLLENNTEFFHYWFISSSIQEMMGHTGKN